MAASSESRSTSPKKPPRAWQRMLSGRRLNLLDPSPLDIEIEDIAHGLARVGRWNGQTRGEHSYSVAQHSLLVEHVAGLINPAAGTRTRLAVLLHDAAEYVIGDMISPFKAVIGPAYRETEARIIDAVMHRFGLPAPMTRLTTTLAKKADRVAAYHEATRLAGFSREEADEFFGPPMRLDLAASDLLDPWPAPMAEARFLDRFVALDRATMQDGAREE
ncbi:MAG TPA: HD family hydrolase [Rhabdaerophilum sp.]|nr:HD family hydrolase [Rhabdaerophilum sp.]